MTATTDGMVYAGSRSEFRRIIEAVPSVAQKVRQTVSGRTLDRAA